MQRSIFDMSGAEWIARLESSLAFEKGLKARVHRWMPEPTLEQEYRIDHRVKEAVRAFDKVEAYPVIEWSTPHPLDVGWIPPFQRGVMAEIVMDSFPKPAPECGFMFRTEVDR